jgi:hypothetical protein
VDQRAETDEGAEQSVRVVVYAGRCVAGVGEACLVPLHDGHVVLALDGVALQLAGKLSQAIGLVTTIFRFAPPRKSAPQPDH